MKIIKDFLNKVEYSIESKKDNASGVRASYDYLEKYGKKNSKKTREMFKTVIDNWQNDNMYMSFSSIVSWSEKYGLDKELADSVKKLLDDWNPDKLTDSNILSLTDYVVKNNWHEYIDRIEDTIIERDPYSNMIFVNYISILEKRNQPISTKLYNAIISSNDLYLLKKILSNYSKLIDPKKLLKDKREHIEQECKTEYDRIDNSYMDSFLSICLYYKKFLDNKDLQDIVNLIFSKKGFRKSQEEILYRLDEYKINPEELKKRVIENHFVKFIVDVTKYPGVNVKEIERYVLSHEDFWLSYKFAMNVDGADKERHLQVMMENRPKLRAETISYDNAYNAIKRRQRMYLQMYDELPDEITELDVIRTQNNMQNRALESFEEEINKQNEAISTLTRIVNAERNAKIAKFDRQV